MRWPVGRSQVLWTWVIAFCAGMLAGMLLITVLVPPYSPPKSRLPPSRSTDIFKLVDRCLHTTHDYAGYRTCLNEGMKRLDSRVTV